MRWLRKPFTTCSLGNAARIIGSQPMRLNVVRCASCRGQAHSSSMITEMHRRGCTSVDGTSSSHVANSKLSDAQADAQSVALCFPGASCPDRPASFMYVREVQSRGEGWRNLDKRRRRVGGSCVLAAPEAAVRDMAQDDGRPRPGTKM